MSQTEAVDFLQWLRPGGPWVLTAIVPDGKTETITAHTLNEVQDFVRANDGQRNLYYSVNPTKSAMTSKASKQDIAAAEFLHVDLDPRHDETPEAAKARYQEQIEALDQPASALVDSGNGLQGLFRLDISIGPQGFADVEARSLALTLSLGGTRGTQNIDRILRLPGTTNLPNKKKIKAGRVPYPTKVLRCNGATCTLDAFPAAADTEGTPKAKKSKRTKAKPKLDEAANDDGGNDCADDDEIARLISEGADFGVRSEAVWRVTNELLRRGHSPESVAGVLLDRAYGISAHIYDQDKPRDYARKQVASAIKKLELTKDDNNKPHRTQGNIRVALLKLGVTLSCDQFADRMLIGGLAGFGPVLDDPAMDRMWLLVDQRFRFLPTKEMFFTVVKDTARLNGFHPVRDYLAGLQWDGVPRIDTWLTTYGEAEDTEYTRAVGALTLVAAARRVRKPGCKFDEMTILENEEQGTNKSTALARMAVRDEWFSDDLPLTVTGKQVIEALRGRWIIEAGELSGMRRGDVEHLKAFLSRQVDRARMSYDRLVSEVPRQSVIVGTTNSEETSRTRPAIGGSGRCG